ncbi:DeoR/GlpR family DNA-binding transcription regulator [Streptococcus cuniculi]|uniref:DeoR/GlpR transcriptional regulator n=1 Tax=Streptococcus cuniculi TaxID=1432788 RepID=A0A4Y9J8F0_9STRE|nr:DeoR/GlpR family DNA-binding transcription regulator [Streptococcus cuniculi]MBF0779232.1 DeoR/GlpR transcriptional regulator [Streptococcus cuniculi]TFU96781.1 DeoR/GlpR transcriptional regulator [Streptococcus cuniculi]
MIPYERQQKILGLLKDTELVKFDEIQHVFPDVSASTLRRDLKELERGNRIQYLSGGAIKLVSTIGEIPITTRNTLYNDKKEKIAEIAACQIQDGDVIYLDSGSTCSALFKKIIKKQITIYTTNTDIFAIAGEIAAEIIVLGGQFNPINSSVFGALTENNLRNIYFKKSFLGVNGIDEKFGVTTPTLVEATKKRIVKEHSDTVFLLADSTKFHNLSNVKAFDLKDVTIISDEFDEKIGKSISILTE